jgi:hypothetical protein
MAESTSVSSARFVTEKEITSARERREEEWKAAYAR